MQLLRNLTKAAFKKTEQDKPTISKKEQRNTVSKRLEAVSEERSVALKASPEYDPIVCEGCVCVRECCGKFALVAWHCMFPRLPMRAAHMQGHRF